MSHSHLPWLPHVGIGVLFLLNQAGTVHSEELAHHRPPNIVFFIADDMQRYMFNCLPEANDPYLTPNLDRLAQEGTLMIGQYVCSPVCTPSRFSCLTGRYASRADSPQLKATIRRDGQSVLRLR